MKKLSKTLAAISALALIMSAGMFVSCSDSDDSDNGGNTTNTVVDDSQNQPEGTTGNNGGSGNLTATYTADFKALTGGTAVSADTYVAGNDNTGTPKIDLSSFPTDAVPLLINGAAKNGLRLRKDTNNINYNGGTAAAFANTVVGATLSEELDRYVALDVSKLATSGSVSVTFTGIAKTSNKGTDKLGQVVLIDQANKILASATNLKIDGTGTAEGVDSFELKATIDASSVTKVTLGFSRGGVGGGGIDVTGITAAPAN